jgi:hypothetical protein
MQYLLLIYENEAQLAARSAEEFRAYKERYFAFTKRVREAGAYVAAEPLQPTTTGRTVRVRQGKRSVTDGPFAETHEALGGFYLIDVEDMDAAVRWAEQIPAAEFGCIEVRPIRTFPS